MNLKSYTFLSFILSTLFLSFSLKAMEGPEISPSPHSYQRKAQQSLEFLDKNFPKDTLKFLSTKYPQYIQESHQLPALEENTRLPKEEYLKRIQNLICASVYEEALFGDKVIANRQRDFEFSELQKIGSRPAKTIFDEFVIKRKKHSHFSILEDVALAAHQIDDLLLREGQAPVIFLGRTPCFVQVAYEELFKYKNPDLSLKENIIHLNFSGTPDAHCLRSDSEFQDQKKNIQRNMVTEEKLSFYQDYLSEKGLSKVDGKLYITDIIGTGGSLNSFLRILRHYYQQKMPDIHFICLSLTMGSDHHHPQQIWKFEQKSQTLTFSSGFEKQGIRPLKIKTTPLQLSFQTIRYFLDNNYAQDHIIHGIEFPAQKWRKEFKNKLKQGGEWHETAYKLIRPQLEGFVKKNENELRKERDKEID